MCILLLVLLDTENRVTVCQAEMLLKTEAAVPPTDWSVAEVADSGVQGTARG